MKSTIILFYFLPIFLWLIICANSSKEEGNYHEQKSFIGDGDESMSQAQNLEEEIQFSTFPPDQSQKPRFFDIENRENILPSPELHNILYDFLSLRDLLKFFRTCKVFYTLLEPNENNEVTYVKNLLAKNEEKTEVDLDWLDLQYFLSNSLNDAFYPVEVFNIKKYHYAAILKSKEIKYFPACILTIPFWKTLLRYRSKPFSLPEVNIKDMELIRRQGKFGKKYTDDEIMDIESQEDVEFLKCLGLIIIKNVFSRREEYWIDITEEGKIEFEPLSNVQESIPELPRDTDLKQIKALVSPRDTRYSRYHDTYYSSRVKNCFVVLLEDGRVFGSDYNFRSTGIYADLQNVTMLFSTYNYAVALFDNGRALILPLRPFMPPPDNDELTGVKMLFSNGVELIALFQDGHIEDVEGECIPTEVRKELEGKNVITVLPQDQGFAAIYKDGEGYRKIEWKSSEAPWPFLE